jgi:hypothetical protein
VYLLFSGFYGIEQYVEVKTVRIELLAIFPVNSYVDVYCFLALIYTINLLFMLLFRSNIKIIGTVNQSASASNSWSKVSLVATRVYTGY